MKNVFLAIVLVISSTTAFSQTAAPAVKLVDKGVAKDAVITSFESTLADGKICLARRLTQSSSGSVTKDYFIRNRVNAGFNQGKTFTITIDQASFDNYFEKSSPELAQKLPLLHKYAQDNRLSYSDESSWLRLINYFNTLN
jgi:hypothetical protein